MSLALRLENVSKMYHLGEIGYGTLRNDVESWWARLRGKEDPNRPVRSGEGSSKSTAARTIMALEDISLEHRAGEVTGIVGSNGAGKSTLLKLISGLTAPTSGRICVRGRVGSLLEVGTGFHPELTGRENVYLNGAILGMTKAEVRKKFDEIVAFSGVEQFIDTPVKRYSSGMFVRLGFAVAAHLEPEILLIDEVLAVGDAQFQKKCREKTQRLAQSGKTVLFVSHSMNSIREICHRGIVIHNGRIFWEGSSDGATQVHLELQMSGERYGGSFSFYGPLSARITYSEIKINDCDAILEDSVFSPNSSIRISVYGECSAPVSAYRTSFALFKDEVRIATIHDLQTPEPLFPGRFRSDVEIPPFFLRPGQYSVGLQGIDDTGLQWISGSDLVRFIIMEAWSDNYQADSAGLVNLPLVGRRIVLDQ